MGSQIEEAAGVDEDRPVLFPPHSGRRRLAGRSAVPALHGNAARERGRITQRLHYRPRRLQRAHRLRLRWQHNTNLATHHNWHSQRFLLQVSLQTPAHKPHEDVRHAGVCVSAYKTPSWLHPSVSLCALRWHTHIAPLSDTYSEHGAGMHTRFLTASAPGYDDCKTSVVFVSSERNYCDARRPHQGAIVGQLGGQHGQQEAIEGVWLLLQSLRPCPHLPATNKFKQSPPQVQGNNL